METEKQGDYQPFHRTSRKPAQLNARPRTTTPRKLPSTPKLSKHVPGKPALGKRDVAKRFRR